MKENGRMIAMMIAATMLAAASTLAAEAGGELWILNAGRGPGAAGSSWMTDLWITNPSDEAAEVELTFLDRTGGDPEGEGTLVTIEGGETLMLPDVVGTTFGRTAAFGAIRIEAADEDDEGEDEDDTSDLLEEAEPDLLAYAHVYDDTAAGTVGLMLPALASADALMPEAVAYLPGVSEGGHFRTNWFGVNLTEEGEEGGTAEVLAEALDASGAVVASKTYVLAPGAAPFIPLSDLAPALEIGTLRLTMIRGNALFAAARVDNATNDPSTIAASSMGRSLGRRDFTDVFATETCTWSSTGGSRFFPLEPGLRLVLEGEEDGEAVELIVEVLSETLVVDGVTTRVVTETESVDGELVEVSRNYFAECTETGDVFYFGEHVDDYEDGEIVGHGGEWLAGENGARAGIMMPGRALDGSRYYQEIAPEVAMDRAEHIATDVSIETPAGSFEGCLVIEDSTPLEPGARDRKVYCPGIGVVFDAGIELVSYTNTPAP